jgi:deoxyribose-phosphate aldolase
MEHLAKGLSSADLARLIDYSVLKPEATADDVRRFCAEARAYHFWSVCVNPIFAGLATRELAGSSVVTCSVVAFPFGATTTAAKVAETRQAVADGAAEIDMVLAIGALKAGNADAVRGDIAAVKQACGGALLKVIIEACLLTDAEKVLACRLAKEAGADFVKTSTGFAKGGATVADVALMRRTVGPELGVKAAGGVRTFAEAMAMVEAGATRIGTSAGIAIVAGRT